MGVDAVTWGKQCLVVITEAASVVQSWIIHSKVSLPYTDILDIPTTDLACCIGNLQLKYDIHLSGKPCICPHHHGCITCLADICHWTSGYYAPMQHGLQDLLESVTCVDVWTCLCYIHTKLPWLKHNSTSMAPWVARCHSELNLAFI